MRAAPSHVVHPAARYLLDQWRQIDGEARPLAETARKKPKDVPARQGLADLAVRSAAAMELALSHGDEDLHRAFREQIRAYFSETRWRLDMMAGKGSGAADFALGALALHGILDKPDLVQACRRFAAAVQKGFAQAHFRHGQCMEEAAPEQARVLIEKAAGAGHPAAMEYLGRGCLEGAAPDAACARSWLERAAKGGRASALTLLGWMRAEGVGGDQDLPQAALLYREAAQWREPSALNNLGELLENGRGVQKDEKAAFDAYRQAAELGFPPGQFNLGRLYAGGKGVGKNVPEARRWLDLAARAGIDNARKILALLNEAPAP